MKASKSSQSNAERKEAAAQPDFSQLTDMMLKNYDQAFHTAYRMQEEATRWLANLYSQPMHLQDWQKPLNAYTQVGTKLMPLAQRRMEEMIGYLEKTGRSNSELMKKAMDAAATQGVPECQNKWMDVWTSSMSTVRSNVEDLTSIGTHAIDGWVEFVRKNAEMHVPKNA